MVRLWPLVATKSLTRRLLIDRLFNGIGSRMVIRPIKSDVLILNLEIYLWSYFTRGFLTKVEDSLLATAGSTIGIENINYKLLQT